MRAVLADISRELAASVSLGYLDVPRRELVYVERSAESSAVRYQVKFGPATHLHARASGKLLVALQPEATWPEWFGAEPYTQVAARTHTRFKSLQRDLKAARSQLVATTQSEHYDGISGCAVPVLGSDRQPAAAIGIAMIGEAFERNREQVRDVLHRAAETIGQEFALRRIDAGNIARHL